MVNFNEDTIIANGYVYLPEAATGAVLSERMFSEISNLAQVFSCEFCEISKNTFFTEHIRVTASYLSSRSLMSIAI